MRNSGNVKEKLEVSRIFKENMVIQDSIVNTRSEDVTPSEGPGD